MRTHYGPWQPCWISNQHQKHKAGRGPSSEHFWQVWLISVQRFQRRRFKCEKLTDGRTDDGRLPMTKAHLWPGELKKKSIFKKFQKVSQKILNFHNTGIYSKFSKNFKMITFSKISVFIKFQNFNI